MKSSFSDGKFDNEKWFEAKKTKKRLRSALYCFTLPFPLLYVILLNLMNYCTFLMRL